MEPNASRVLAHGDRIIIGNHHFFRLNIPSMVTERKDSLAGVRDELIIKDYRYAREELERVQVWWLSFFLSFFFFFFCSTQIWNDTSFARYRRPKLRPSWSRRTAWSAKRSCKSSSRPRSRRNSKLARSKRPLRPAFRSEEEEEKERERGVGGGGGGRERGRRRRRRD